MSRVDMLSDSVKSALAERADQMRQIASSAEKIRQISESAESLPEKIEASATAMAQTAEAMARLIEDSDTEIRRRREYLTKLDGKIETQAGTLDESQKAAIKALNAATARLSQAADRAAARSWTTGQVLIFGGSVGLVLSIALSVFLRMPVSVQIAHQIGQLL